MAKRTSAAVELFERGIIEQNGAVVERWKHMLDVAGQPAIENAYDRYALARLLDSTNKVLTNEAASVNTTTAFGTSYVRTMLGMTRQVYPRAFGLQLVSVQPMDRPTGKIFHLSVTRDDGSSLGKAPSEDQSLTYSQYIVSQAYAEHTAGEGGEIAKGMKLAITDSDVAVDASRKLKTSATWELSTDLAAYHSLNAMDILQGAAVDEISQELDARIVYAVRTAAIANGTVTFGHSPTAETWSNGAWGKRLQRAILNAEKIVFSKSLRMPNVMVCGLDAMTELRDLATFAPLASTEYDIGGYGVIPTGSLSGQYQVFMSRAVPDDEILIGRRGSGFLDAGIVYAPYVGLFITDRFFDIETQRTIQSFAQRDKVVTVSNTAYARIRIDPNANGIS